MNFDANTKLSNKDWFENLTGFKESSPDKVKENILLNGQIMTSIINGKSFDCGVLEISSLSDLRRRIKLDRFNQNILVDEVIGDVQKLHKNPENTGALFQVASQFNLLEMVNPYVTPEEGVSIYCNDYTQGPACAIACGAATLYRNYFVPVKNKIGQSINNQIDCLEKLGEAFENDKNKYWAMKNGYCISDKNGLNQITKKINTIAKTKYEELMGQLKVGVQWNTQVTLPKSENKVTQVFCSALPLAYSNLNDEQWESFSKLILNATYEATFYLATKNMVTNGSNKLFLTLVGGGAFGNRIEWILSAINRSVNKFKHVPLNVMIVSHKYSNKYIIDWLALT